MVNHIAYSSNSDAKQHNGVNANGSISNGKVKNVDDITKDGWTLKKKELKYLRHTPYLYNCCVASSLELSLFQP